MPALTEFAPAKLNLALHVRARNPDGYHDLESIFAFVDFGDTLHLTHEVISLMLGVTRPGVTIAAGTLQKSGLIQYSRGRLTIVDRPGLEQAACECYGIVSAYYRSELD